MVAEQTNLEKVNVVDNAAIKRKRTPLIKTSFARERVLTESSDAARELFNGRAFGTLLDGGKVQLSLKEALYLLEKKFPKKLCPLLFFHQKFQRLHPFLPL